MKIIALLIAVSLLLAILFLILFFTAVKNGQFEDLESPGFRILKSSNKSQTQNRKLNK